MCRGTVLRLVITAAGVLVCAFAVVAVVNGASEWEAADRGGKGGTMAAVKSDAAPRAASEAAVAKVEKTLAAVQERLMQLQSQELHLNMEVLKAQQKANESRADAAGRGANPPPGRGGRGGADSPEYRKACVWAAQQNQALDARCLSLVKTMQGLAKESPGLSAELQARLGETTARAAAKHRAILEKMGSLYNAAGEWKSALAAYMQVYQDLPEDQRAREPNLQQTIAELCERVQDYKTAALLYKSILDGMPEGRRWRNWPLCDRLGRALERAGDLKSALAVYKSVLEAMPPDRRDSDRGPANDINRRIADLERQLGVKP